MRQKRRLNDRHPEASPADQSRQIVKDVSSWVTILALALGIMSYLGLQLSHLTYWNKNKEIFFYDQNIPLMTTEDAYYYLRLTSDLLDGHYNNIDEKRPGFERPHPIPLIVSITAMIHQASEMPIERIAFFLPPVLASLMVIVYLLWGSALGGPVVVLIALLAGSSSLYWCSRTGLGRFDTDCLNPVFFYLIIFCVYRFASIQSPRRFIYFLASLFLSFLFRLWWVPGGYLAIFLIALTYSTSLFLASSRAERLLKICLLTTIAITCIVASLNYFGVISNSIYWYLGPGIEYLDLITPSTSLFPNVGQSITELQSPPLRELIMKGCGTEISFLVSIIGLFFLSRKKKDEAIFLLPGILFGLASLLSQRFLLFFVPVYAIGIGYFLGEVFLNCRYLQAIHSPFFRRGVWSFVLVLLLVPSFYLSFSKHTGPSHTAYDVRLARTIASNASSDQSMVWGWWDFGYFLQYFTGKKTIIDGGSQSPERTFIASFPMACDDLLLSRNWMQFFAAHELNDLEILVSHMGDLQRAIAFLKEVLAKPVELETLLSNYGLNDLVFWRQYLFPQVETLLFLNFATLNKSYWWYFFGTWDLEKHRENEPRLFSMFNGDFSLLQEKGFLVGDHYVFEVDKLISVGSSAGDVNQIKHLDFKGRNGERENLLANLVRSKKIIYDPEAVVVINKNTSVAYLFDEKLFQALVCRLLLQHPFDTDQFIPLAYFPSEGGAWKLQ
jgi:hypothetical protein